MIHCLGSGNEKFGLLCQNCVFIIVMLRLMNLMYDGEIVHVCVTSIIGYMI